MHLPSHSVQNVESQTSAFIDFSIFPQISRKTVFTAAVCKSHMSRNAFDIWISLHKGFKYFFLFFTVGLERNTVLHISGSMILFIFPDMIRFYSKRTSTYGRQSVQKSLASSQLHKVLLKFPSKLTLIPISFAVFRQVRISSLQLFPRAGVIPLK